MILHSLPKPLGADTNHCPISMTGFNSIPSGSWPTPVWRCQCSNLFSQGRVRFQREEEKSVPGYILYSTNRFIIDCTITIVFSKEIRSTNQSSRIGVFHLQDNKTLDLRKSVYLGQLVIFRSNWIHGANGTWITWIALLTTPPKRLFIGNSPSWSNSWATWEAKGMPLAPLKDTSVKQWEWQHLNTPTR